MGRVMVGHKAFCELHDPATDDSEVDFAIHAEPLPELRLRRRKRADASRLWTAVTVGIAAMLLLVIALLGMTGTGSRPIDAHDSPPDAPVAADPSPAADASQSTR